MKFLTAFVVTCLVYQVSAGGVSFSSAPLVTPPPTVPLCPQCEDVFKNGATLSESDSCDPIGKKVCAAGGLYTGGGGSGVFGYCAGTATNPYPKSERSPVFSSLDIYC
jgi:hypothetical protein